MTRDDLTAAPLLVLLVGAAGAFGRRLAEGLAREPGIRLILAGRTRPSLARLRRVLGGTAAIRVLDRDRVTPADLEALHAAFVIDAAGPFQDSRTALIEAAIDAGCHYIDLADGREFVSNIRRFGAAAQRANVAVLSGASSTPALSHAVLDGLTEGWRRIDTLRVAISPGNRAPRGLAVMQAILSWAGRPVRVFRDGGWTTAPGWGASRRIEFPGLGVRLAALCETPDLDLMVERYEPRIAAEFLAGLELRILHYGLALAALPVRCGWLRSLLPLARPLRFLATLLRPFGSDRGGMVVEASGRDAGDRPAIARWSLVAEAGTGPYVPTLAALALVRQVRDGCLAFRGAAPCTGILTLDEFAPDFARLGIVTATECRPVNDRGRSAVGQESKPAPAERVLIIR
ncbi:MAG: saccharopine dehydrogenase NADP-binding domain-containing protein [Alphaproteobacteria bacterium]|nr:saccharopine dehydrogenase NADP-binding domain-containing protein [Alphaproteobacteria bacterium]